MVKFGDAFAAARKAGKKEFTWKGKKYHTKTKEEMAKAPTPAKRTTARPGSASGSTRGSSSSSNSSKARGSASMPKRSSTPRRPVGFSTTRYTGPK